MYEDHYQLVNGFSIPADRGFKAILLHTDSPAQAAEVLEDVTSIQEDWVQAGKLEQDGSILVYKIPTVNDREEGLGGLISALKEVDQMSPLVTLHDGGALIAALDLCQLGELNHPDTITFALYKPGMLNETQGKHTLAMKLG